LQKWAGRSVWYDRRVRNAEAAGSNPARSTFTPARPLFESPLTLEVILDLKKQGKAEDTINGYSRRLRHLAKNTDINNPETVKEYITNKESSNANKEAYSNAYDHFVKFYGLKWKKPFFIREERLPNVPASEQVNTIIPTFTRKYTTIFSILRDTGLRPIELHRLRLKNINLENGTITPKTFKHEAKITNAFFFARAT
jgi:integrase